MWKMAGYSAQEIAQLQGRSVVAVDTLFSRAKQKIRNALGHTPAAGDGRARPAPLNGQPHEPAFGRESKTETADGKHISVRGER
jgi:hypothetical protein